MYTECESFLLSTFLSSDDIPKLSYVMALLNLSFAAAVESKVLQSVFADLVEFSKKIVTFTIFLNLLSAVKNYNNPVTSLINACEMLEIFILSLNDSSQISKQAMFLLEQLQLLSKSPTARSSSLFKRSFGYCLTPSFSQSNQLPDYQRRMNFCLP